MSDQKAENPLYQSLRDVVNEKKEMAVRATRLGWEYLQQWAHQQVQLCESGYHEWSVALSADEVKQLMLAFDLKDIRELRSVIVDTLNTAWVVDQSSNDSPIFPYAVGVDYGGGKGNQDEYPVICFPAGYYYFLVH